MRFGSLQVDIGIADIHVIPHVLIALIYLYDPTRV